MLLTKKTLNIILENQRVSVPTELEKQLLDNYGGAATTEDGRIIEYSEQDICEQLRKIGHPYENANKEVEITLR